MSVFKQEIKKTIIKRHILLLLFLVLVLRAVYGTFFQETSKSMNLYLEDCKEEYFSYLSEIEGSMNNKKASYIETIINQYEQADAKILEVVDQYEENELSQEAYTNTLLELSDILEQRKSVNILSSYYDYVLQDTEHRYFIYQNGWINLFEHMGMDICLLFLIIVTVTPIFCTDYETDMYLLNRVSLKGDSYLYWIKLAVGVAISSIFTIILWLEDILINHVRYGLSHPNYPIQSIHIFSTCQWNINIGQGLLLGLAITIIGSVYLAALLMLVSVLLKKAVSVILAAISFVFLPLYILPEERLYSLPLPSGFVAVRGYLLGMYDTDTGQNIFFDISKMILLVSAVCVIIAISSLFIKMIYSNKFLIKKLSILPLFCLFITLTGCATETTENDDVIYNNKGFGLITLGENYVINACNVPFTIINKDGETPFIRDPFVRKEHYESFIIQHIAGDNVYYSKTNFESGDFDIMCLNVNTFENKTVYTSHPYTLEGYDYLRIGKQNITAYQRQSNDMVSTYWIVGTKLYLQSDGSLYEIDLQTKKKEEIISNMGNVTISYLDGKIFYVNNKYLLEMYSIDTQTSKEIGEDHVATCFALKNQVLVQTMEGEIFSYNPSNGTIKKLCTTNATLENANEKYFYCINNSNTIDIYSIVDGEKCNAIHTDYSVMEIKSSKDGKQIYAALYNGKEPLYQCFSNTSDY